MIGNIESVEIKIDEDVYQLTKLYARESYPLYLRCAEVLAPLTLGLSKANNPSVNTSINIGGVFSVLFERFSFDEVLKLFKASGLKKNGKDVAVSAWNVESPLLIFELFGHILKLNIVDELLGKKKDFSKMLERLIGSKNSLENSTQDPASI